MISSAELHRLRVELAEARALRDTAVDAIVTIDETGVITSFNPAAERMFGRNAADMIGAPVTLLMPEPHKSQHDDYIKNYLDTDIARVIGSGRELEAVNAAGKLIPIHLSVSEYWVDGHRRFLAVIRDLSDQRRAEEAEREIRARLMHADRVSLIGEMSAGIAHEINQPLAAIALYARAGLNVLRKSPMDMGRLRSVLDKLNRQSLRAGSVVERIQFFVRDRLEQPTVTDINNLMAEVAAIAANDARLEDIELKFHFAEALPAVLCDPVQIQQVGVNLIRNAIDAMNGIGRCHGNTVDIVTRAGSPPGSHPGLFPGSYPGSRPGPGDSVIVEIVDRGPGVEHAFTDNIFKPFQTTKAEGMGIGLSICKSIMEAHKGSIGFHNNETTGATFYFCLPEAECPPEAETPPGLESIAELDHET